MKSTNPNAKPYGESGKENPFRGLDIGSQEVTMFTDDELAELERDCENWEGIIIRDESLFGLRLVKTIYDRDRKLAIATSALKFYSKAKTYDRRPVGAALVISPVEEDEGKIASEALSKITSPITPDEHA